MASACAWPSGVLGSSNSSCACASALLLTDASSGPDRASMPVIWPHLLMKVRRVGSPRSQASTSAAKPASKSRRSRSFITSSLWVRFLHPSSQLPSGARDPRALGSRMSCQPNPRSASPSIAETRAVIGQPALPALARQDGAIDDAARLAPVLHFEHRPDIGGADTRKTLVRPAQRVRRQHDVVELQDGIVGIGRLLLQHVQA